MKRNHQAGRARREGCEFRVLTEDDLADIHLGTIEVLERTGVFVEDEEAREIFAAAGATVDADKKVVRIPGHVVEQAIRTAPSKLRLAGRNPRNDIVLEAGRVGFTNFGEGVAIVDPYTGELKVPTKQDVADTAKVVDALPNVDVYERAVVAEDIDQRVVHLHQVRGLGDQHVQARVHGLRQRLALQEAGRDGVRHRRRAREAQGAPDHLVHHLPGEPAQAGAGHLRDHHDRRPRARRRQHPLDGDGRRLVAGDAGRHARDAQRRGAGRHHAQPAHPAGRQGRVRQLHDGHGPAARLRERRLARVRAHQRRPSPRSPASTCCPAGWPVRRATPRRSMPKAATRRP